MYRDKRKTDWFVNARFGMFIHWGLYALPARHEKVRFNESITTDEYRKYFDRFDPDLFDAKAWARTARNTGMKYLVITAKHHDGFCLWDSQYTDYKITNTPCGCDLLREVTDAFRAEGLKIGFYYSLIDWHHPDFTVDKLHPHREIPGEREKNSERDMRKYAQYMRNQLTELLTGYGRIDLLWVDFSYAGEDGKGRDEWESEALINTVRAIQPEIMINNRLDLPGCGDFKTPESLQPRTGFFDENGNPEVWEACQTFSGSWGYFRDEHTWREPIEVLCSLIDCVSKGGNLLLNVGPTGRGRFDKRALERFSYIADWMEFNSRAIYNCGAAPEDYVCPPGCKLTFNSTLNRLYIHVLSWPYKIINLVGKSYVENCKYVQLLNDASEISLKGLPDWQKKYAPKENIPILTLTLPLVKPDVAVPVIEIFLK